MRTLLLALSVASMAMPLGAQTTLCSRQTIGTLTYTTCTNGYSSVTQQIGDQQFLLDNRGRSAQILRNGSFSYYSDNTGVIGTTQRLGSLEYLNLQSRTGALRGTSQRIGNFDFLDAYGSDGSRISGWSTRIGNTTYGSYQLRRPGVPPIYRLPDWP